MSDPDAIRRMLLLEEAYFFLVFVGAMAVGFGGVHALRALRLRTWVRTRAERRHVAGAALFGAGWSLSNSCPGPIAAQLGQGVIWSLATIAGITLGIVVYAAAQRRAAVPEVPLFEPR